MICFSSQGPPTHRAGLSDDTSCAKVSKTPTLHSRRFRKYALLFVLAVGTTLLASGLLEIWTS